MGDNIKIIDTATPFLKMVAREFPGEVQKAVKSSGWWMQQNIKQGIKSGAPGGEPYQQFSGLPKLNRFNQKRDRFINVRRNPGKKPLGRLGQAVRYQFYSDSNRAIVGWISPSAEKLGTLHEEGGVIPITPQMRRQFWAAGIPLGLGKTTIAIPKRPTIDPEYRENAPKVPGYLEQKLWEYMKKAESK
jgi:hypothetical protein